MQQAGLLAEKRKNNTKKIPPYGQRTSNYLNKLDFRSGFSLLIKAKIVVLGIVHKIKRPGFFRWEVLNLDDIFLILKRLYQ